MQYAVDVGRPSWASAVFGDLVPVGLDDDAADMSKPSEQVWRNEGVVLVLSLLRLKKGNVDQTDLEKKGFRMTWRSRILK